MIWQEVQDRWMSTEQIVVTLNTNPALCHVSNISGFAHIDQHTFAAISEDRTVIIWQKNPIPFARNSCHSNKRSD
jgi:hypothetical protein